jgi:signal transduction histidine kinase
MVRACVADVCSAHSWPVPELTAPEGLVASVDPVRICQVLTNLISNAYKFAPSGSRARVVVEQSDGGMTIAVSDEGPGVPEQRRDQLFEKFERLGQEGPGMGLGLYISRAIARAHGGDLTLGPDGRTFVLAVPLGVPAA